jgi:hypothetical protein
MLQCNANLEGPVQVRKNQYVLTEMIMFEVAEGYLYRKKA